jgi:hypothetical protein
VGALRASGGSLVEISITAASGAVGVGLGEQISRLAAATAAKVGTTAATKLVVNVVRIRCWWGRHGGAAG